MTLIGRFHVRNDGGTTEAKSVEQRIAWAYMNGCDGGSLPVAEGDRIGWITFVSCATLQLFLATISCFVVLSISFLVSDVFAPCLLFLIFA